MCPDDTTTRWLTRPDGHRLAYRRLDGAGPGVIFLAGYASDMSGAKALHLEGWCRRRGLACLRFDYLGHGESTGAFADGTLGRWLEDARAALDALTRGPQILVGSSMGGWIMLLLASLCPERIAGLVGIAAAPDFSQDIWWRMSEAERARLEAEGRIHLEGEGEGPIVTARFLEECREHLTMRGPIPVTVPVRLLQGMRDDAVPWRTALEIAARLRGDDVAVTLVKDGDHRLSRETDLERLGRTLGEVVALAAEAESPPPAVSRAASAASPSR